MTGSGDTVRRFAAYRSTRPIKNPTLSRASETPHPPPRRHGIPVAGNRRHTAPRTLTLIPAPSRLAPPNRRAVRLISGQTERSPLARPLERCAEAPPDRPDRRRRPVLTGAAFCATRPSTAPRRRNRSDLEMRNGRGARLNVPSPSPPPVAPPNDA